MGKDKNQHTKRKQRNGPKPRVSVLGNQPSKVPDERDAECDGTDMNKRAEHKQARPKQDLCNSAHGQFLIFGLE
jgi:hypothetical protein